MTNLVSKGRADDRMDRQTKMNLYARCNALITVRIFKFTIF
jgi:hypothetical protein